MSARLAARLVISTAAWLGACGEPAASAEPARETPSSSDEPAEVASAPVRSGPLRVLVTGFHDWHDLGDPPAIWRCRDNPSCRLLVGGESQERPTAFEGPLVERLERGAPEVEWTFSTLPVAWGAFRRVPGEHDVIVNIGLGVYDRFDSLQLERGAYNLHDGADGAGEGRSGAIDPREPLVREPPARVAARLDALAGRRIAGFEVVVADARDGNSYLCNETHWHALGAIAEAREAYFLHIPRAADGDYTPLADAVAGLVLALVER